MMCSVCGKVASEVTVFRVWLCELVRSDECPECYAYMNEKCGAAKVTVINELKRVDKSELRRT